MTFASVAERDAIEAEMPWEARGVPTTLYGQLEKTAKAHPDRPAVSYQLLSGPGDPAETLSWRELFERSTQAANLFRSLGIGEYRLNHKAKSRGKHGQMYTSLASANTLDRHILID